MYHFVAQEHPRNSPKLPSSLQRSSTTFGTLYCLADRANLKSLLARGAAAPWREIGPIPNLSVQICQHSCFDTIRLSANIAHGPALLTTSHLSPYAMIVPLGEWKDGSGIISLTELRLCMESGHGALLFHRTNQMIACTPFEGERYQLELFMPEVLNMSFQEVPKGMPKRVALDGGEEDKGGGEGCGSAVYSREM